MAGGHLTPLASGTMMGLQLTRLKKAELGAKAHFEGSPPENPLDERSHGRQRVPQLFDGPGRDYFRASKMYCQVHA
jgi:hypothetical protein